MKIFTILPKFEEKTELAKKRRSGTDFYRFLVDFAVPWGAKNQKKREKNACRSSCKKKHARLKKLEGGRRRVCRPWQSQN